MRDRPGSSRQQTHVGTAARACPERSRWSCPAALELPGRSAPASEPMPSDPATEPDPPADSTLRLRRIEANSLFRKILRVSPCGSRFYPYARVPRNRNSMKIRILEVRYEKNVRVCTDGPARICRTRQCSFELAPVRGFSDL